MRDLLHVDDLVDLIDEQLRSPTTGHGVTANVGGGRDCSLSLLETTELCRELTGNDVPIEASSESRPGDVPIYISDCERSIAPHGLAPAARPAATSSRTSHDWIADNERAVDAALA